ncbi:MAG: hypothetical protein J7K48_03735 [Thermococcus sp.]|nr:hypothetical protein [Thermococcus sp.]
MDEWFEICAHGTSPLFPDEKFKLKLSLIDLSGRPIKENSECLIYKPKEPGVYKVNAIDDGDKYSKYLEPVVLDTYTIKVYVNPVIEESPSEIESILKDAKDTFTIHIKNVEDDSKGDYFLKNPSKAFEVKLYDPNGVLYDKTEARYTASLKVPDKDRPGYWRIVVSYPGHPEFSNEVEFYVEPKKKDRIVNISATGICGPGALIPLSLLALGLVRKRK